MDQQLAAELLAGDSDEISDLRSNITTLEGFINLIQKLDSKPNISKRFWEESRSLYQGTSKDCDMATLETQLSEFFGPPVKAADKPLPRKLNKESAVKHLGGIQKEQSLFLMHLKTGTFYGALWPWRHNKTKIEIHLGYCSDWMVDEDYHQLETLVKRSVSQSAFAQMDAHIGGQIRGIGLPSFLQMAEMEQSTFTLKVTAGSKLGELHVANGKLLAAQTEHWSGQDAAYRIISWDEVTVEISPIAENVSDEIHQPLMHVLMESLKIKDEITSSAEAPTLPPPRRSVPSNNPDARTAKKLVRLERTPLPPKPRRTRTGFLAISAIVLAAIVLLGTGGLIGLRIDSKKQSGLRIQPADGSTWNRRQCRAESWPLLKEFLQNHANSAQIDKVKQMTEAALNEIEKDDYEEIALNSAACPWMNTTSRKPSSCTVHFWISIPIAIILEKSMNPSKSLKDCSINTTSLN